MPTHQETSFLSPTRFSLDSTGVVKAETEEVREWIAKSFDERSYLMSETNTGNCNNTSDCGGTTNLSYCANRNDCSGSSNGGCGNWGCYPF